MKKFRERIASLERFMRRNIDKSITVGYLRNNRDNIKRKRKKKKIFPNSLRTPFSLISFSFFLYLAFTIDPRLQINSVLPHTKKLRKQGSSRIMPQMYRFRIKKSSPRRGQKFICSHIFETNEHWSSNVLENIIFKILRKGDN